MGLCDEHPEFNTTEAETSGVVVLFVFVPSSDDRARFRHGSHGCSRIGTPGVAPKRFPSLACQSAGELHKNCSLATAATGRTRGGEDRSLATAATGRKKGGEHRSLATAATGNLPFHP
jgi:hypothetical protein